jgi:hypothetical protein
MHADGIRRLAVAVLQLAVEDLHHQDAARAEAARRFLTRQSVDLEHWTTLAGLDCTAEYRRIAAAFMARRGDFDEFWCVLARLEGGAVRERLSEQSPHREEAG